MRCMSEGPASRPGNKMQWICALANKHLKQNIRTYYIIWRAQTVILNILKFTVSLRQQSLGLQASVLCGGELTIFRTNGSHRWLWHRVWCLCLYLWRGRARSICREKCSHHWLWHREGCICVIYISWKKICLDLCAHVTAVTKFALKMRFCSKLEFLTRRFAQVISSTLYFTS